MTRDRGPEAAGPAPGVLDLEEVERLGADEVFARLSAGADGLASAEAERRLAVYGPNAIERRRVNPLLEFLSYFWGPIPWMIEVAAVLSGILRHWPDFIIIMILLVFNALVGFRQEHQAAGAVEALRKQLAIKARARRDGAWTEVAARDLVPGDVIRIRLGDIVPADVKLLEGDYLSVDQAALTGESLPVDKQAGAVAYSGSVAKQGEMVALVVATGSATYFGRTARLVSSAGAVSHFQRAVLNIGDYLIYLSLFLVGVLMIVQLARGTSVLTLIQFALILTVASIPVAMPAVLSVTMAVGAVVLSRMKAIVTRLESIEEMAGMDVLCSDKTGTLTQNALTLGEPEVFEAADARDVILAGALASKAEDQDAIDLAVLAGLGDGSSALQPFTQTRFVPFDPVSKRSEAEVRGPHGEDFRVAKGAPQVILDLCKPGEELRARAEERIEALAGRGFRTLGVARIEDGRAQFLGLLPLFDPPREDSAETIAHAREHGIGVKMVTGDDVAIAHEVASELGLASNIQPADAFLQDAAGGGEIPDTVAARVEEADGFARVFPEHKFAIVKVLQRRGHIVGMTGDGVNDAPALKQADVGVAVSGATDAARAASDLVLTAPGLSVIVTAVEEARRIFERMNSYAIYRITETIRIMFFVVLAMIAFDFYPITAILIILLALFNDLPIMTIAYDNTWLDPAPVRWDMRRVLSVSTALGLIGVLETFGILLIAKLWLNLDEAQIQTLIFLKLAVAGHLTLFVARSKRPFLSRPHPAPIVLWSAVGTKLLATLLVAFGLGLVTPISWAVIGLVWGYCIVWIFIEDLAKIVTYRHLELSASPHRRFLSRLKEPVHGL